MAISWSCVRASSGGGEFGFDKSAFGAHSRGSSSVRAIALRGRRTGRSGIADVGLQGKFCHTVTVVAVRDRNIPAADSLLGVLEPLANATTSLQQCTPLCRFVYLHHL